MANMGAKSETTVPCSEAVRDRIKSYKEGGEAYDSVLRRLCDVYEAQQKVGGSA